MYIIVYLCHNGLGIMSNPVLTCATLKDNRTDFNVINGELLLCNDTLSVTRTKPGQCACVKAVL